jgi:Na+/melibiose symporter-like transporter
MLQLAFQRCRRIGGKKIMKKNLLILVLKILLFTIGQIYLFHWICFSYWMSAHPHYDDLYWGLRGDFLTILFVFSITIEIIMIICFIKKRQAYTKARLVRNANIKEKANPDDDKLANKN